MEGKVEQPRGSLLSTTEFNEVLESIRQERQCPPPAPDPTLNCADPGIGEYLLSPNDPSYDPDCSRYITTICYDEQDDIYLHYLTQTSDVPSTILPDRVSAAASTPLAAAADPTSNAAADPPANATGQADSMKRGGIDGQGPVAIAPGDSMATPPEVRTSDQLLISMGMGAGTGNSVDVVETSGSAAEPAPSGAQLSQGVALVLVLTVLLNTKVARQLQHHDHAVVNGAVVAHVMLDTTTVRWKMTYGLHTHWSTFDASSCHCEVSDVACSESVQA